MGVLTDYFRAPDAASVVRVLERTGGGSPLTARPAAFDGVEAKRLDPVVVFATLVAAVRGVPWQADLVEEATIWPASPSPGPEGPADEDDPWATGPWVMELRADVRDTLAGVADADIPEAVARWVQAEELDGVSAEAVRPPAEEFVRLARAARESGERLYCWMSL
jgi:hypothetical protein